MIRDELFDWLESSADEDIYLLIADVGWGIVDKFSNKYPARFYNCGICEQHTLSMAAGLALCGKKPVIYGISTFITFRAFEQLRYIAYENLSVALCVTGGENEYPNDGFSHNCERNEDIQCVRQLPNIKTYDHPTSIIPALEDFRTDLQPIYVRMNRR